NAVCVFLRKLRQCIQLIRSDAAKWNFDPLHSGRVPKGVGPFGHVAQEAELLRSNTVVPVTVVVALPVTAAAKPRFRKNFLVQLSGTPQRHLALEDRKSVV